MATIYDAYLKAEYDNFEYLKKRIEENATQEEIEDEFLLALIAMYALGINYVGHEFDITLKADDEEVYRHLYQKIDGEDFADRIGKYYGTDDMTEKLRVVLQTEGARMFVYGQIDGATAYKDKFGIGLTKTWDAVMDNKTRDDHFNLDGTTIPFDEYFEVPSGDKALAPLMFESASQNANCRCILKFARADI